MNLEERIQRGKIAIAQAKAKGWNVREWEEHLERLERRARVTPPELFLTPAQWYPHFRDLHHKVIAETADFDYGWLRTNRPDLYQSIKAKENELDAIQEAKLSEVMAIIQSWRELILKAEFERRELDREARADISK